LVAAQALPELVPGRLLLQALLVRALLVRLERRRVDWVGSSAPCLKAQSLWRR
jgi:hypothetical protein